MANGIYNKYTGYHNRQTLRLRGHDYSQSGYYFITLCIFDWKMKLFGDVVNGCMVLNDVGQCAQKCWLEIPVHFPNVTLDEFVVMPNHVHGVIVINESGRPRDAVATNVGAVGANNDSPLHLGQPPIRGTSKTIGSMIRGYKIGVTKWLRSQTTDYHVWQRNYFDHIVRNENLLKIIRKYIRNNPLKWSNDRNNHLDIEMREFADGKNELRM